MTDTDMRKRTLVRIQPADREQVQIREVKTMNTANNSVLTRSEYTEKIYAEVFGEPASVFDTEDVIGGIERALEIGSRPVFLEGLSERLTRLGTACSEKDTELMLAEVMRRYTDILGKSCPRTVREWCRGTTPGVTNRRNNYELCYALEMDYRQTAVFFQKNYLSLPFIVRSRLDAVFLYCLYHRKPYSVVTELLERSKGFVSRENAHTSTSQIAAVLFDIDDDEKFLRYLSEHCYGSEQSFQLARKMIGNELEHVKARLLRYSSKDIVSPKRLGALTIRELLGEKYQTGKKYSKSRVLPKRFTESLPNDVTLGKIVNGEGVSYELLRKTLALLKFNNFYNEADNCDEDSVRGNLMDFYDELNTALIECGFAQLYVCHPFDCLLLFCANSYEPIDALNCVMNYGRNPNL